jgi:glycosyltransferase involved in cell wall biosynthesis
MQVVLLEPFMTGSHAAWARGYQAHSQHHVEILSLEGKYWKWRMHGGAVTLARQFLDQRLRPDLLLATDMLDLTTFLALTRQVTATIPVALYMHENQLSYPWSPTDADPGLQRDAHYCFINYSSALAADALLFNSDYHRTDFLCELPGFLKSFPDCNELDTVQQIAVKSRALHLGLDLRRFDQYRPPGDKGGGQPPLILWNHRWEYDKNPDEFFQLLFALQEQGVDFELAVLGESYHKQPEIFNQAQERLKKQIVHWGYAESFAEYAQWLWRADILPVTSMHDFFGISVVEAIYCDCYPLLPERLAYPEHFPQEVHAESFYSDRDELLERLVQLCRQQQALPETLVDRYDWKHQAPIYDQLFSELADGRGRA